MQTKTLVIDDQPIAYRESTGAGPAVLLIHGNSSSSRTFERQLESEFGHTHRVVAIDLPGFGDSQPVSDPDAVMGLQGWAHIVRKVVPVLRLEDAVLVGWSLGGHVALEAVGDLPGCKGVVIYGTPPLAFPPDMASSFLPNPAMGAAFTPAPSEDEMRAFAQAFFAPEYGDIPDLCFDDVRRADGRARAAVAGSIRPGGYKDEVDVVRTLTVPLAVLQGAEEQLVNGGYFATLAMPTLWQGKVQVIAGAGHAPHWEQAAAFNALLTAFVADCGLKTAL
jgi:pimeloyl-ACP methyl ester carboxylesterase